MNLTWHIVKKDLRALKWPIGIWLLCIVAKLGIGVLLLNGDGTEGADWFGKMDAFAKVLNAFSFISFVLTAAVIQQDLLVGTTAFWMTRPISGGRLLRAKLITLGLVFGVMPVLVNLPWWIGCHYGIDEVAWAALETLAVQAIVVLLGMLWSVVTDGFARFLMWTLVTLFATPTLIGIVGYAVSRRAPPVFQEVIGTRFVVVLALAVVGIATVVVHQYLTRKTERSIGIIAGAVGLIVLTGAFWPWSLNIDGRFYSYVMRRAEGQWPAGAEPAGLKFTVTSAQFLARRDRPDRPGTFVTKYLVEGVPAGQGLMPVISEHRWRWPDGTEDKGRTWGRSGLGELLFAGVRGSAGTFVPAGSDTITFTGNVTASTMGKIRGEVPAYSLPVRFLLMRLVSADPVPLQSGKWTLHGTTGERIANAEKEGPQLLVTFIRHNAALWIDNLGGGPLTGQGDYSQYFLLNRATNFVDRGNTTDIKTTRIGTVGISWRTTAFTAVPVSERKGLQLAAINALNDAQLVKVTLAEQARFSHELTLTATEVAKGNP